MTRPLSDGAETPVTGECQPRRKVMPTRQGMVERAPLLV